MSVDVLRVVMDLEDDGFRRKLLTNGKELERFKKRLIENNKHLKRSEASHKSWGRSIRETTILIQGLHYTILDIGQVTVGWQKQILDVNGELERGVQIMKNFSKETSQAAIDAEANSSLDKIIQRAEQAPFSMKALQDSMVKLKVSGIDEVERGFGALTEGVAAFGGTDEVLKRASIAIQQMGGKGVVSMEELRQQLGEAVPQAAKMMARSLNLSYGALVKLISEGKVKAEPALQAMLREMELSMTGSAAAMMNTWSGLLANLNTQMIKLSKEFGDSGYFDEAKKQLGSLNDYLRSEDFRTFARDMGVMVTKIMVGIIDAGKAVKDYIPVVLKFAAAFLAVRTAIGTISAASSVWTNLNARMTVSDSLLKNYNARMTKLSKSTEYYNGQIKKGADLQSSANKLQVKSQAIAGKVSDLYHKQNEAQRLAGVTGDRNAARAIARNREILLSKSKQLAMEAQIQTKEAQSLITSGKQQVALRGKMASQARYNMILQRTSILLRGIGGIATGLIIPAVTMMIYEWYKSRDAIDANITKILALKGSLDSLDDVGSLEKSIAPQRKKIALLSQEVALNKKIYDDSVRASKARGASKQAQLRPGRYKVDLAKSLADLTAAEKRLFDTQARIARDLPTAIKATSDRMSNAVQASFKAQMETVSREYRQTIEALEEKRGTGKGQLSADKIKEKREAAIVKHRKQSLVLLDALITKEKASLANSGNRKAVIEATVKKLEDFRKEIATNSFDMPTDFLISDSGNRQVKKFESIMLAAKVKTQALRDKLNELPHSMEAAMLKLGKLTGQQKVDLREVYDALNAQQKLVSQDKSAKKASKAVDTLIEKYADMGAAAATALKNSSSPTSGLLSVKYLQAAKQDIDEADASLRKLLSTQIISQAKYDELTKKIKESNSAMLNGAALRDTSTSFTRIMNMTEKLEAKLKKTSDGTKAYFDEQIAQVDAAIEQSVGGSELLTQALKRYRKALVATVDQKYLADTKNMMTQWTDFASMLDTTVASSVNNLSDTLTNFLTTGKANFKSFADDVIKMITKMIVKMMIAKALGAVFGGATGGAQTSGLSSLPSSVNASFAKGGIMTEFGQAQLTAYQNGGIQKARSPKMALFGEGAMNEAYVPLPDGKTIPVTMSGSGSSNNGDIDVNIINQTGQQASGQASKRMDGEKMVIDILLKSITSPGPVRESIKGVR